MLGKERSGGSVLFYFIAVRLCARGSIGFFASNQALEERVLGLRTMANCSFYATS